MTVGTVCYRYRRERKVGALPPRASAIWRLLTPIAGCSRLVANRDAAGEPVSDELRATIFERAIWHYTAVYRLPAFRVGGIEACPVWCRRRNAEQLLPADAQDFAGAVPARRGHQHPASHVAARLRPVERGAYRLYSWQSRSAKPR